MFEEKYEWLEDITALVESLQASLSEALFLFSLLFPSKTGFVEEGIIYKPFELKEELEI